MKKKYVTPIILTVTAVGSAVGIYFLIKNWNKIFPGKSDKDESEGKPEPTPTGVKTTRVSWIDDKFPLRYGKTREDDKYVYYEGSKGPNVVAWQKYLNKEATPLVGTTIKADGYFGVNSVKRTQEEEKVSQVSKELFETRTVGVPLLSLEEMMEIERLKALRTG